MKRVAQRENVAAETIRDGVARGRIVIPANIRHLAGTAGGDPVTASADLPERESPRGHPGFRGAALWVNQSVAAARLPGPPGGARCPLRHQAR
jgi:hypothetical protein